MKPSVGRMVHYVAYGTPGGEYPAGAHRAAIIAEVFASHYATLCVINPTGIFFAKECLFDGSSNPAPGTWHWPERVED